MGNSQYFIMLTMSFPPLQASSRDMYWCNGGAMGGGQNKLGLLLMKVRSQLRGESRPEQTVSADKHPTSTMSSLYSTSIEMGSTAVDNAVIVKSGDLLTATEQYIAHQCNCLSTHPKGM